MKKIKLTQFSGGGGWASKLSAKQLAQVLSNLKTDYVKNNHIGFEASEDCSFFSFNDNQMILQSVDFFTPIVDDPFIFGQIAAANSLSDVYAKGGKPLFALNIVEFPIDHLPTSILSTIINGGYDIAKKASIPILGGHSIKDNIPKYGLVVTGIIDKNSIIKNNTIKEGDDLILTKPIGTGIVASAIKKSICSLKTEKQAIAQMIELNKIASEIMVEIGVNACTDITGYGLIGHLFEMAKNSNLTIEIKFNQIPLIENLIELIDQGCVPGGSKKNLNYYKEHVIFNKNLNKNQKIIFSDAQTSGGLLISCPKNQSTQLIKKLNDERIIQSSIIGEVIPKKNTMINIIE